MGIPRLLKILGDVTTRQNLSAYRGKRAGIDGYTWLHRSLYCIGDGILKDPIDISRCINFFIKKLQLLLKNQITPIIIFDGDKLPMKFLEEDKREIKRKEFEKESDDLLKLNNIYGAISKKIEAFDVTPEFAYEFIKILKIYKIEYYVAPYEADAQLAYLSYINYVDLIITEDSDLIAYGCKCVLYKLGSLKDAPSDVGEEILFENIKKCKEIRFKNFSQDKFLNFCILIGCDYLKILGVGPKLANEALNKFDDYNRFLGYIFNKNLIQGSIKETIERYEKTFLTFRYQVVYCPIDKKMKYFRNIDDNTNTYCFLDKYRNDLSFLGDTHLNESKYLENYIKGNINPITKEDIDEESDDYYISKNVVNLFYLKNHANQMKEDDDSGQNDYYYNSQDVSAENLKHFNFFPKMGKYKTKKLKKNEKPKNQFGIESFFGAKKEPKKRNSNINNNANDNISNNMNNVINQKIYDNENIDNNEDKNIKEINNENSINLGFFNDYIFNLKNSSSKRTYNDLEIIKDKNHSKKNTNPNFIFSKEDMNLCYNPLIKYPQTKNKPSIGSKQKKLYDKFNLRFQDETNKKEKEKGSEKEKEKDKDLGLEMLDNYGFSETNYNSNKEIFTNPLLCKDIINKNNNNNNDNDKKNSLKENKYINNEYKESKKAEEKFIYIGDDNSDETEEIKCDQKKKEDIKENKQKDLGNDDFINLDDYKNTFFTLDKF